MSRRERLDWANKVLEAIRSRFDVGLDEFLILAGRDYYRDLIASLPRHYLPLGSLRMGERVAWLNHQNAQANTSWHPGNPRTTIAAVTRTSMCLNIHTLANGLQRYMWDTIPEVPFRNGIYIVFEKGETYHDMDRIVRVGTHTSQGRLKKRLSDHFVHEKHDGSIFRKNVGKAILNAYHDPYLYSWTVDTSKPENAVYKDAKKNAEIEARVSKYLRGNFSFVVFPVDEKEERLRLEEGIISSLHHAEDFAPSEKWAGRFSPEAEIRESGMWLKKGLDAAPLTTDEFAQIQKYCAYIPSEPTDVVRVASNVEYKKPERKKPDSHGKYSPLYDYLSRRQEPAITLSFDELEIILGFQLPPSASKYTMWWSGHAHCKSWTDAGYRVSDVQNCILNRTVVFLR